MSHAHTIGIGIRLRNSTTSSAFGSVRTSARRCCGGWFWDHDRGISLGCPLSSLMGAFFLHELDERMARTGPFHVRFMDDILVLAPSRWKLRRAVKAVNAVLGSLRLEKHPDKTFIGKIERGFDFPGTHFSRDGLGVATATIEKFIKRASRLYEQKRMGTVVPDALRMYLRRWLGWVVSGVGEAGWIRKTAAPQARRFTYSMSLRD